MWVNYLFVKVATNSWVEIVFFMAVGYEIDRGPVSVVS